MNKRALKALGIVAALIVVAVIGGVYGVAIQDEENSPRLGATAAEPNCELGPNIPTPACFAAGAIRFVSMTNLQGAAQFCKWRAANPGEWNRLKGYASTGDKPDRIITWFGGHIQNDLEAYFATGAPPFTMPVNHAPNVCRTPLVPPKIAQVTPGETDVTVTVATP